MSSHPTYIYQFADAIDHLPWPDAVAVIQHRITTRILSLDQADTILALHPRATPQLVAVARVTYRLTQ